MKHWSRSRPGPHKPLKKTAFLLAAFLCALVFGSTHALATSGTEPGAADIPAASESFYVYDGAEVLSPETEAALVTAGQELDTGSGAQLVVMTMRTVPGDTAAQRVEYADQVIKSWNIGGDGKKGLLLLLSVDDGDYWAVSGAGLKSDLTNSVLKKLLDDNLESDFSGQAYDAGVTKFYTAAVEKIKGLTAVPATTAPGSEAPVPSSVAAPVSQTASGAPASAPESQPKKESGAPILQIILVVVLAVAALLLLFAAVQARRRQAARRRKIQSRQKRIQSQSVSTMTPRHYNSDRSSNYRGRYK